MAKAKPVIASNVGQIGEAIKPGINGLLTNNKVDDIVEKIFYLKKNPHIARKLGAQARRDVVRYYNWDRVAKDIETTLYQAIAQKK